MPVPVHRHADAVQERREGDDHLGVVLLEPEVAHRRGLDAVLGQLAEELERDVGDDLDVDPGVVVDPHPHDRVHVRDVPPALQLLVLVHPLEQLAELAVAAHRQVDVHLLDRLRRRQARLAHRLLGDRLVDPLLSLLVEIHQVRTTTLWANLSCRVCRRPSRSGQRWSRMPGTVKSAHRNAVESQRVNALA